MKNPLVNMGINALMASVKDLNNSVNSATIITSAKLGIVMLIWDARD